MGIHFLYAAVSIKKRIVFVYIFKIKYKQQKLLFFNLNVHVLNDKYYSLSKGLHI